ERDASSAIMRSLTAVICLPVFMCPLRRESGPGPIYQLSPKLLHGLQNFPRMLQEPTTLSCKGTNAFRMNFNPPNPYRYSKEQITPATLHRTKFNKSYTSGS